ncbi:thermonuclease family protein [Sphingobacterium sp. HMA12]|uniref:thermonuclease family protein n=1 Tax=Sphingobacterium sp. HMA12 TaxID=2050894 RepID=UPI0018F7F6E2|nr:thermonuclease family protein [Sphingobacterium sp. HMA12]
MKEIVSLEKIWQLLFVIFFILFLFINCGSEARTEGKKQNFSASGKEKSTLSLQEEMINRWQQKEVYVTKVIDGDTFWVNNGSEKFKVRFIGIDAPETRNSRGKLKGPYAKEAREYVQQLTENKWVKLELDVQKKDRYKRLLAYIYLLDGTFLNADLVKGGFAVVDTYPPNVKHTALFVKLQHEARESKKGVWALK